jgi:hypothetical protein
LTTHLRLIPRLRMSGAVYVDSPVCLHGLHRYSFLYCLGKVPVCDMKAYRRRRGIVPPNLSLGSRWWRVVNFTSRPLFHRGKNSRYPLDWGLGGPRSQPGCFGEEVFCSSWDRTPHCLAHSLGCFCLCRG